MIEIKVSLINMLKDLKENSVMRRKSKFKKERIEFVQMRNTK